MTILAKNPIFASNPSCLADFVQALTQSNPQAIPTPMQAPASVSTTASDPPPPPEDGNTANPVTAPTGHDAEDSDHAIAARKQFWSKFKKLRPCEPLPTPTSECATTTAESRSLASLDTLVLGQEDDNKEVEEVESQSPIMAQPVEPGSWVNQVSLVHLEDDTQPLSPEVPDPKPAEPVVPVSEVPDPKPAEPAEPDSQPLPSPEPELPDAEPLSPELPDAQPSGHQQVEPVDSMPPPPQPEGNAAVAEVPPQPEGNAAVAEVLKRVNTVDIQQGNTPSPPHTLLAPASPGTSTVVLMDIKGFKQPVTIPLTPQQCLDAGLVLANSAALSLAPTVPSASPEAVGSTPTPSTPGEESTPRPSVPPGLGAMDNAEAVQTAAPQAEAEQPSAPQAEAPGAEAGIDNQSSRQMLRNMYMRFHRSQKRYLNAIYQHLIQHVFVGICFPKIMLWFNDVFC